MTDEASDPSAAGTGPDITERGAGWGLVRLSWSATVVFSATAVAAVVVDGFRPVAAAAAIGLFAAGVVVFLMAYGRAVSRSRTDAIGIGGLFFLAGDVAPTSVRRHLLGSLGCQTAVALATAAAAPYTSLAFGVLVPMLGLGLAGLWGARHGAFGPRAAG